MVNLVEDAEISLDGILISSRSAREGNFYEITDGNITFNFFYDKFLNRGQAIKLDATINNPLSFSLNVKEISVYKDLEAAEKRKEIEQKILSNMRIPGATLFVEDTITLALVPLFKKIYGFFALAKKLNRFVLLKYHNDADGISAALCISSFLRCKAESQKSAVYTEKDAIRDMENLSNEANPLVVFVDFGSGIESMNGLKLLKSSGADIVIVDHHPPDAEINKVTNLFVSPWVVHNEDESSAYPAGFLCAEIAKYFTNDDSEIAKLKEYAKISCAGDKSNILDVDEEDKKKALAIDYIALYGDRPNLNFYKKILVNEEILKTIIEQADEKLNAILENAKRKITERRPDSGVLIYLLELEDLVKSYDFPSKGKAATTVFEALVKQNPTKPIIVIGYGNQTVVVRLNEKAAELGHSAKLIVEKSKVTMKDFVESAGGHQKAAAVRVKKEFAKSVAEELVKIIETSK